MVGTSRLSFQLTLATLLLIASGINAGRKLPPPPPEIPLPPMDQLLTTPFNCSGWPEPRVYVEGQSWLTEGTADPNIDAAHLHVGACMPWNQTVQGKIPIDVVVEQHDVDYRFTVGEMRVKVNDDDPKYNQYLPNIDQDVNGGFDLFAGNPNFTCNATNSYAVRQRDGVTLYSCKQVFRIWANTAALPFDGRMHIKVRATWAPVLMGNHKLLVWAYARFPVWFANGNGRGPWVGSQAGVPASRGAAFGSPPFSYVIASLKEDFHPMSNGAQVSGLWTQAIASGTAGARVQPDSDLVPILPKSQPGVEVTRTFVSLDPAFHRIPAVLGNVILDKPTATYQNVVINTTALSNGIHKLFVRTDVTVTPGAKLRSTLFQSSKKFFGVFYFNASLPFKGCTLSGVMLVPFNVNNTQAASAGRTQQAVPPPPPPPSPKKASTNSVDDGSDSSSDSSAVSDGGSSSTTSADASSSSGSDSSPSNEDGSSASSGSSGSSSSNDAAGTDSSVRSSDR